MKKILFLLVVNILIVTVTGCTFIEQSGFPSTETIKEKNMDYTVEKIALSKGFQSTEPNVEIVKRDNTNKLLISLGLVESSGAVINKIVKKGENINIYTSTLSDESELQLAVPQLLFGIEDLDEKLEDLNFNIINENYEPIPLKFSKNQILNNVYSKFEITATNIPEVELNKSDDEMTWDISFQNIFDSANGKSSLINFNVKVDALTGEILNSKKDDISTYIDEGSILDYLPNTYLLYKKEIEKGGNKYDSLWLYDLETGKRDSLYTSKDRIGSASFSPSGENIALIEVDGSKSDLYIVSKLDRVPYKITPSNYLNPRLMKWKDSNSLYFINITEDISTLLTYRLDENKSEVNFSSKIKIDNFDIFEDEILITESNEESINKTIYTTSNGLDLKEIGSGFKASYFDGGNILFLNNIENENKNILHKYDLKNEYTLKEAQSDVKNYFKIDDEHILFIEKNTCNNNYTLNKHNIFTKTNKSIANITSDKLYYNPDTNIGFLSLVSPDDTDENIIYSIKLNKLYHVNN